MQSVDIMRKAVKLADNKKARNITVLDVRELTTITDYFVICHGGVGNQLKAIANEIEDKLALDEVNPHGIEGYNTDEWILMDYSDVIINIFTESAREFFGIEQLWADAKIVNIDDIIE